MQNSVSHQVSSQLLYGNGYTDNIIISDVPMQMGISKLNENDSSFYVDSSLYPEEDQFDGLFAFCSQVPINYQSGAFFQTQMNINGFDHPASLGATQLTFKSNIHDTKKQLQLSQIDSLTAPTNQYGIRNTRKRQVDNANVFQQRLPEIIEKNKSYGVNWPANKKISLCFQGQPQSHFNNKDLKDVKKDRMPAKRSQKLADRITALQKLVSPYGKTDTASVLHEASMFIKALQEQIENMFHTQNPSHDDSNSLQTNGEKQYNLRNKGLCLISLSNTRKIIREDGLHHYSPVLNSPLSPENLST